MACPTRASIHPLFSSTPNARRTTTSPCSESISRIFGIQEGETFRAAFRAARSGRVRRSGGPNMARHENVPEGCTSLVQARPTDSQNRYLFSVSISATSPATDATDARAGWERCIGRQSGVRSADDGTRLACRSPWYRGARVRPDSPPDEPRTVSNALRPSWPEA